jgi:hypothetical protein
METFLRRSEPDEPSLATRVTVEALGAFALTFVAAGGDVMARISGEQVPAMARALAPGSSARTPRSRPGSPGWSTARPCPTRRRKAAEGGQDRGERQG